MKAAVATGWMRRQHGCGLRATFVACAQHVGGLRAAEGFVGLWPAGCLVACAQQDCGGLRAAGFSTWRRPAGCLLLRARNMLVACGLLKPIWGGGLRAAWLRARNMVVVGWWLYCSVALRTCAMSSDSSDTDRSDRRGPDTKPEEAAAEGADAAAAADPADAEGKDAAADPADKKSSKEDEGKDAAHVKPAPAREASRKPGGARKNWRRKDGDDDTWTCPDCHRVIKDQPCSKDQNRVSAYCFSFRLWNAHAFGSDWAACEEYGKKWAAEPDRYDIRGGKFCQVKPPASYWKQPRTPPGRPPPRDDYGREKTRNRPRSSRSRERRGRRDRSRSRSNRHRLRSRDAVRSARSADRARTEKRRKREPDSDESVEVEEEDEKPRPSGSKSAAAATASKGKAPVAKTEKSQRKEAEKKVAKSSGKDGKSAAEKTHKSSEKAAKKESSEDEYTYTSSPEEDKKKPLVAAKSAAKSAAKAGAAAPLARPKAAQNSDQKAWSKLLPGLTFGAMAETLALEAAATAVLEVDACLTEAPVVAVDAAQPNAGEAADKAVVVVEASAEAMAHEDAIPASQPRTPEPEVAICRRCQQEVKVEDAMCTPKFRMELRYTCKPCHATLSQLQRRGVDVKDVLTESAAVTFFVDAKNERANGMEGRLCYQQARALLLQKMIESTTHREREGSAGEFQPLGFWMLRGYDCDRIEALAERRDHPILGPTFRVDIDKMSKEQIRDITEERLLNIESQARERQQRKNAVANSSCAAAQPALPDLGVEVDIVAGAPEKKRKTPEEKQAAAEAAKVERQESKKRQKLERCATSAAAKVLPQLKKCSDRLNEVLEKVSTTGAALPEASVEQVTKTKATLEETVKNATHMLAAASKGQALSLGTDDLQTEKGLNGILRDGDAAIRTLQHYIREKKEITKAAKAKSGAAKAKAKAKQ
eukprot:s1875_g4.t1